MEKVTYRCLACHQMVPTPHIAPAQWEWDQRQVPRMRCPACGCACAPEPWRLVALEVCAQHTHRGMQIDKLAHAMWSGCPSSYECQVQGLYATDCEEGLPARPQCLVPIHSEIELKGRRIAELAGSPLGLQISMDAE